MTYYIAEDSRLTTDTDRFDRMMAIWSDWMHAGDSHRLGPKTRDSVCGQSMTNYMCDAEDSDIVADENDRRYAKIVDACVESLMPPQRLAVLIHYGFARMWPFSSMSQPTQLDLGLTLLRRLVARRC